MVPGPHQHRLVAEQPTVRGMFQDRIGHRPGLGRGIVAADQGRSRAAGPRRVQLQPRIGGALRSDGVGEIQQTLARPEVLLQPDHRHVLEGLGQVEQMSAVGTAEAVDGLGVVADHGQARSGRPEHPHDVDLGLVHVLVLVDEHMVPSCGDPGPYLGIRQQRSPCHEQVVEVEHSAAAFACHITAEKADDGVDMRL